MSYQNTMDSSEIIGGAFTPTGPTGGGGGGLGAGETGETGADGGDYSRTFSYRGNNSTGSMTVAQGRVITAANGQPVADVGLHAVFAGCEVTTGTGIPGLYKITICTSVGVQGPFADEWEIWIEVQKNTVTIPGGTMRITVNGEDGVSRRRNVQRSVLVQLTNLDEIRVIGEATDEGGGGGTASFGGDSRFNCELVAAD